MSGVMAVRAGSAGQDAAVTISPSARDAVT